jgi:3'-5' exoribonuclease
MFKEVKNGRQFAGQAIIQGITVKAAKNGSQYADANLTNHDETVPVKIWEIQPDSIMTYNNKAIDFTATRSDYNGKLQFVLDSFSINPTLQLRDLLPASYWDNAQLKEGFNHFLMKITDPIYQHLVRTLYNDTDDAIIDKLSEMPAAIRMHHAFIGGLYTHTLSMAYEAEGILTHAIYAKTINQSLLYAGILLHDLGKAFCYTNATDHTATKQANLLEHVAIIDGMIVDYARNTLHLNYAASLNDEHILNLRHLVLSHHGKLEYGAAIKPATPEAMLLHHVDDLDAHMEMMRMAESDLKPGTVADQRNFGLDGAFVYHSTL